MIATTRISGKPGFQRSLRPLIVAVLAACAPGIQTSRLHPDADKQITFDADRGSLSGTISQMQIQVGGAIQVTTPGSNATYSGGPYFTYSNHQLPYCAVATQGGGNTKQHCDWVYVANPKFVFGAPAPNGGNNGYPNASSEQTGPNLYRLDKPVVSNRASDAIVEYVDWYNARDPSTSDDITVLQAANTADHMVAAVAWYVDHHMSWRDDTQNQQVFAANGFASYSPGWDFPQPADLTLTISGNLTNAAPNDDYEGDCEDHAILRAALLRAMGFAPWAIWDAIDGGITHEYNIVLYDGAYRIMDYGTIDRWLQTHTWASHESNYAWNESNGPRGVAAANHTFLVNQVDNYPGGKTDHHDWSFNVYYRDTSP